MATMPLVSSGRNTLIDIARATARMAKSQPLRNC